MKGSNPAPGSVRYEYPTAPAGYPASGSVYPSVAQGSYPTSYSSHNTTPSNQQTKVYNAPNV